ncbi:MAG: hypothetical protein L0226_10475 [Acidobacteria bacterium]|nr:hypothetical protein [Acidobacteriota bacterium]MCI0665296.1 hypothetical protein [Acidobacteriota bacterium]
MFRKVFLLLLVLCALSQSPQQAQTAFIQQKPADDQKQGQSSSPSSNRALVSKTAGRSLTTEQFSQLIERSSEPNGYFDTDNLISNEASYLHVLGKMRQMNVSGGAYVGVGPDQNFSYIAQVRPAIAFIVDIRRDNLLQHLLFKSLFALSRNRLEYLCLLFGKPAPADLKVWDTRNIQELVEYLEKAPTKRELFNATMTSIQNQVKGFGVKLEQSELETIGRIHAAFFDGGLDLKFTSRNRPPRYYYPSYRDLLLEKDLTGKQANYLSGEEDFRFLKSLQERNLIIPVVGNLAGNHTLKSIAQTLAERGERVSAFYTSNVEFYLMRGDDFDRFAENIKLLPRDEKSVIIRSYFNGTWGYPHPQSVNGYFSTQLLQTIDSFVKEHAGDGYRSYTDVISKHNLELK